MQEGWLEIREESVEEDGKEQHTRQGTRRGNDEEALNSVAGLGTQSWA